MPYFDRSADTHLSSASHTVKFGLIPIRVACLRRYRAHRAWKVPILTFDAELLPISLHRRSCISFAALLVNVTAHIDSGESENWDIR